MCPVPEQNDPFPFVRGIARARLAPMKVAAYQAPFLPPGSMDALDFIRVHVRRCEVEGISILCSPEAILGGLADDAEDPRRIAISAAGLGGVLAPLSSSSVTSIVGFTEIGEGDRLYNSAAVFHRGSVVGVYRKLHPAINRSVYSAGRETPVFHVDPLTLGIVICNDSNYSEPAMLMVVFTLSLLAGSTQLSSIAAFLQGPDVGLRVSLALALVALVMVAIAENARIPVDNPATHLELTMVHEAMILEYSGRYLALIELASFVKLLLYISVIGCVFAPWGIAAAGDGFTATLTGLAAYVGKLALAGFLLAAFETAIAKMRVFRYSDFLGAALMLGVLAALLRFVSRLT